MHIREILREEIRRIHKIFEVGPTRKFAKAAETLYDAQLKQQQLQKKFVAEKNPKKKEALKKDLITMHRYVQKVQSAFNAALNQEPVDLELEIKEAADKESKPTYFKGLSKKDKEERERVIKRRSKMKSNDPDAYKGFRSDKGVKTKPSVHNKKFKQMFGEELLPEAEAMLMYEKLSAKTRKALKNKAEKANAPLGALTQVYNKGLAAWRTGHRPGASQAAWAMARVNSFLTGGKARKVDAAQWNKVKKHRKK